MKKTEKIKFKIKPEILNNYVAAINSIKEPMNQLKEQLNKISRPMQEPIQELSKTLNDFIKPFGEASKSVSKSLEPITEQLRSINIMSDTIKNFSNTFPNEQTKIFTDAIKQIMYPHLLVKLKK